MNTFRYIVLNAFHWSNIDLGAWKRQPVRISPPVKYNIISPYPEQRMAGDWIRVKSPRTGTGSTNIRVTMDINSN